MWHVWKTGKVHTGIWLWGPEGKKQHGRPRYRRKWIFKKWDEEARALLICFMIGQMAGANIYDNNLRVS
jgi:hypothetical protein